MQPYDQPEVPTTETTPSKLRKEITKLKSNIAEQEEVLKFHQKQYQNLAGAMSPEMSPEAWSALSNISQMVTSESQNLNSSKGRLFTLEERLAAAERAMELRAKRMSCSLSFCPVETSSL